MTEARPPDAPPPLTAGSSGGLFGMTTVGSPPAGGGERVPVLPMADALSSSSSAATLPPPLSVQTRVVSSSASSASSASSSSPFAFSHHPLHSAVSPLSDASLLSPSSRYETQPPLPTAPSSLFFPSAALLPESPQPSSSFPFSSSSSFHPRRLLSRLLSPPYALSVFALASVACAVLIALLLYFLLRQHELSVWSAGFSSACIAQATAVSASLRGGTAVLSPLSAALSLQSEDAAASTVAALAAAGLLQGAPVSFVFVTQPSPSLSSPTALLITAAFPASPSLLNSDLLSIVDMSSVPFSDLECNVTLSSQPTASTALNLSASSVWLLQAVYDVSASPSQPPLLLVVALELQTALSQAVLATGYDMQVTLLQESWSQVLPLPGPPPGSHCGAGGGGPGAPPPPPPSPSAAVSVFSAGQASPGSPPPSSTSQSLNNGESSTADFIFADLPYQVVCVPTQSAVDTAYSSSLLAFTIVIPLFVALLSTLWLVWHRYLHRADGIVAAPASQLPPPLPSAAASSAADGDKRQHGSAGLHVLAYFLDRLNNPLHQILSLLAFLEENTRQRAAADAQHTEDKAAGGGGDSEARAVDLDIISSIRQQAMIMSAVIQDASDIRALEAAGGAPDQLQPLHLAALLQTVSAQLRPHAQEKGVSVLCSVDASLPVVYGDGRRVAQLLRALLSSVISLHSIHGSIVVTVKQAAAAAVSQHSKEKERKEEAARGTDSKARPASSSPSASPLSKLRQQLHVDTDRSRLPDKPAAAAAAPALPPSLPLLQVDSTSSSSSFSSVPLTASLPLFATSSSSASSRASSSSSPVAAFPCIPVLIRVVLIGCTIRREKLSSLFNPFNPSSPSAAAHQEGLGLALVNTIVTALKGRVEVRSSQSSTAFHVLLPFALSAPAVSNAAGADGTVSPFAFPSQADGGNDDGYAVHVKLSDDGVEVEDVALQSHSDVRASPRSSHRDDAATAAPAKRPTPASNGRRVKGEGGGAADDKEEEERDQYSAETELASTSQAAAAFYSSSSAAVVTPTFVFRSSAASLLTPSSSPSSAGLSVSTASPSSAFQLYTPSGMLLRSSTEALPYPGLSSPTHHRFHPYHHQAASVLAGSSPQFSTVSVGSSYASGSGVFPGSWVPYTASAGHERRERRKSGSASEMSLMTRQVQEAKQKMRTEGASYDQPDPAAAAQPLSLVANPRRLSGPTADAATTEAASAASSTSCSASSSSFLQSSASSSSSSQPAVSESPMQSLGRAASAPGTSAASYRGLDNRDSQSPSFAFSEDAGEEAAMSSRNSAASSPALADDAAAAASSEPKRTLPSSALQPRSLSNTPTTASSVLPPHYALLTPNAPLNDSPQIGEAGAAATASGTVSGSGTPPIAPRQKAASSTGKKISRTVDMKRAATYAADSEEKARCDSVRRQLQSGSVLVVDDAEINVKIALRMLTGIDCLTATDGLQAVELFRRRSGIDDRQADGSGRAAQQMSPASTAASSPAISSPSSSCSAPTEQPSSFVFSPSSASSSSFHLPASAEALHRAQTADTFSSAGPPFALLLMDVVMPVMSGLEATRIIRSLCAQHRLPYYTPIIAVTGNCTAQDRKAANAAGFDFLLAKPFTRAQLFEVMDMALTKKDAEERGTAAAAARAARLGRTSPTATAPSLSLAAAGGGKHGSAAAAGGASETTAEGGGAHGGGDSTAS